MNDQVLLVAVIAVTLSYAFVSGLNDAGSLVATAISSHALAPRAALLLAAAAVFAGFFLFGSAVAATIGTNLVRAPAITLDALLFAMISATAWVIFAASIGLPSSSTYALLGGLIGAVTITHGFQSLLLGGLLTVMLVLLFASLIGLAGGYLFMRFAVYATRRASPGINQFFKHFQTLDVIALGLSYGANDGQKSVAVITMALVAAGQQATFDVPVWVKLICALALITAMATGGWRTIGTLGWHIYRLRPIHSFVAQTYSAMIILTAAALGGPVSTPQVVSTSIMGVGSAERMSGVRWGVAEEIVVSWLLTIPVSALVAAALQMIGSHFGV
ncbi:MAG: inorganic phosphate transporter [Chloroflexi bacterium]|nr:inorganic phosphate transporter [Chloroflexota bacterium]